MMDFHLHFWLCNHQFMEEQHLNLNEFMEFVEDDLLIMELLCLSYLLVSYLICQVIELFHYDLEVITIKNLDGQLYQVVSHYHWYFSFDLAHFCLVSHLFHCWIYYLHAMELNF